MADPCLRTDDLRKNFGGLIVTDGVSLDIGAGELHAVIGPNGAGKTTLINQISGLLEPSAGKIIFNGADVTTLPANKRAELGLARSFQITSVLPRFSALENVALAVQARTGSSFRFVGAAAPRGRAQRRGDGRADRSRPRRPRRRAGRASVARRKARARTGDRAGDAAEAAAARRADGRHRAARNPNVSIGVLQRLKGRFAMLLVEHDMNAVFALADRISVLVYGRILASGTPRRRARRSGGYGRLSRRGAGIMLKVAEPRRLLRARPGAVRHQLHRQ